MENEFEFYCSIVAQLCLCKMSFARGPLCDKFNAKNYYTLNYRHFIRLFFLRLSFFERVRLCVFVS